MDPTGLYTDEQRELRKAVEVNYGVNSKELASTEEYFRSSQIANITGLMSEYDSTKELIDSNQIGSPGEAALGSQHPYLTNIDDQIADSLSDFLRDELVSQTDPRINIEDDQMKDWGCNKRTYEAMIETSHILKEGGRALTPGQISKLKGDGLSDGFLEGNMSVRNPDKLMAASSNLLGSQFSGMHIGNQSTIMGNVPQSRRDTSFFNIKRQSSSVPSHFVLGWRNGRIIWDPSANKPKMDTTVEKLRVNIK